MSLIAKEQSKVKRDPVSQGMHPAICYGVFDIGTHLDIKWNKLKRKIILVFEVPGERIEIEKDGEKRELPKAISENFTLSLDKKAALRKQLDSWRGRPFTPEELNGFDVFNVLGKPCLINVTHSQGNDVLFANIETINPLVKGMPVPKQENENCSFSFDDCKEGEAVAFPEKMPEWIQKKAMESEEYTKLCGANVATSNEAQEPASPEPQGEISDDVPF